MFAISIDKVAESNKLIRKIESDGKGKVNFPILSDPDNETIDAYGLFDAQYIGRDSEGIPKPAIFIMDKNRKIIWVQVEDNYRNRPTITHVRSALDKAKGAAATEKPMK